MSTPIPQQINITHALQSNMIQTIRQDIKTWQAQAAELTAGQVELIDRYIQALESAFDLFTKDNEHIELKTNYVTSGDVQLYNGLKKMYTDYLKELIDLKKEKIKKEVQASSDNPLEFISQELPYQEPNERNKYFKNMMDSNEVDSFLKEGKAVDRNQLLDHVKDLIILDSTIPENVDIYMAFLLRAGFTIENLKDVLPIDSLPLACVEKAFGSSSLWAANFKPTLTTVDTSVESSDSNNSTDKNDSQTAEEKSKIEVKDEPKKMKISFSKYLKKGDDDINENGKRSVVDDNTDDVVKASKPKKVKIKSTGATITLQSILKKTKTASQNSSGKKQDNSNKSKIKFLDDEQLVTVFGEGLPSDGLTVSPDKLKKILKPFKDGQAREVFVSTTFSGKVSRLSLTNYDDIINSDISELKGGPIKCNTKTPSSLKVNFSNFYPFLDKPPAEPVHITDDTDRKPKQPLIVKAFGKNRLLLRKDRGGIPYKPVPEVVPNDYPSRPE